MVQRFEAFERRALLSLAQRDVPRLVSQPAFSHDCETVSIPSADGSLLQGAIGRAAGAARGVVVFCHPWIEIGLRYFLDVGVAQAVRAEGLHTVLFNFKGVGQSEHGSGSLPDDVVGAVRFARQRYPGHPVHLFGVALGGYQAVLALPELDGSVDVALLDSVPIDDAPFTSLVSRRGNDVLERSLVHVVPRIRRSVLVFVHYAELASYSDPGVLQQANPRICSISLSGLGHLAGFRAQRENYNRILRACFVRNFAPCSAAIADFESSAENARRRMPG
jgi:pimeloyl-ACP methyl ester carboxylesterase